MHEPLLQGNDGLKPFGVLASKLGVLQKMGLARLTLLALALLCRCERAPGDQLSGMHGRQGDIERAIAAQASHSPADAAAQRLLLRKPGRRRGAGRRIVGGQEATGSYQWVTLVQKIGGSSITCAGELIAETWMVTAAHCLLNSYNTGYRSPGPSNTEIIYGCIDLTQPECKKARAVLTRRALHRVLPRGAHRISFAWLLCLCTSADRAATIRYWLSIDVFLYARI